MRVVRLVRVGSCPQQRNSACMKFDLRGPKDRHNVHTTTGSVMDNVGAINYALKQQVSSYKFATDQLTQVKKFKDEWEDWLAGKEGTRRADFWFLLSNLAYVGLGIASLVLTILVMNENVEDFNRNDRSQHVDKYNLQKKYPPCGMPTPDSMYLLQALGAVPSSGWEGAVLEPDYKNWILKTNRSLCTSYLDVGYKTDQAADVAVTQGTTGQCTDFKSTTYGVENIEELLALGYLIEDKSITPTNEDINSQKNVEIKLKDFEAKACRNQEDEHGNFYNKQQNKAYGDLKTRVARAYVAAMPAFSRYEENRKCRKGRLKDPFDSRCKHSCHIRKELKAAALEKQLMYTDAPTLNTPFTKQLYRLLALSLAGYYDRLYNKGTCFRNINTDSALEFCKNSMNSSNTDEITNETTAVTRFENNNDAIKNAAKCGADPSPSPARRNLAHAHDPPSLPPLPPLPSQPPQSEWSLSDRVCALTLEYGLFDQARLFGIPDVIDTFVADNDAGRNFAFLVSWIYDLMYSDPVKNAPNEPSAMAKLDMYIAYRLSSTSIWAIMVANVAGFMLVRAALPMGVWLLDFVNINLNGEREVNLKRPDGRAPVYFVAFVNVVIIFWILWLDTSPQSHYYVSTTCEDWRGLNVHIPSGAFETTWGKRRYSRFGQHAIGILMLIMFILFVAQRLLEGASVRGTGRKMSDATTAPDSAIPSGPEVTTGGATAKAWLNNKLKNVWQFVGGTERLDKVAFQMFGLALIVQILFVTQSIISGADWYEALKASDRDRFRGELFVKDALMSVWAAFWTATAIAWFRQKWAFEQLTNELVWAWGVACLLALWIPTFQSNGLLEKELAEAFSNGKGTSDNPRQIIYILIYAFSGVWTVLLIFRLKEVNAMLPKRLDFERIDANRVRVEGVLAAAASQAQVNVSQAHDNVRTATEDAKVRAKTAARRPREFGKALLSDYNEERSRLLAKKSGTGSVYSLLPTLP